MEQLMDLLLQNRLADLRRELTEQNPVDIAEWLENLDNDKALLAFRIMPKDLAADVFAYLTVDQKEHIISAISDKEVRALVDGLFIDDTVDFLEEVPANLVKKVLASTDEETRRIINQFLRYPDNCAGSIMTIEYVDIDMDETVRDAMDNIRRTGVDKETVYTCYVIDNKRRLKGSVALHKLLVSANDALITDVMEENVIQAHTTDDRASVAELVRKYDLLAVPVVDNEGRLVGIVTVDDIVDVIEEENTEDFEKMAAMRPSEDEYLRTPVFTLARNRIMWLLLLMVSATLTGNIIIKFQNVLSQMIVLSAFIPMLMDTGGNCGSQAATMIIRGMALGEIQMRDIVRVLWKEIRVSMLVGTALALLNFARLIIVGQQVMVAAVVCISLLITVMCAKTIGGLLPMLAKIAKLDPALMAAPIITTVVDIVAVSVFFSLAGVMLGLA